MDRAQGLHTKEKGLDEKFVKSFLLLVRLGRFERSTYGLEVRLNTF